MIYLVSDLHIDDGSGEFTQNQKSFHAFLDFVGDNELIIVGDFLDLWVYHVDEILGGSNIKVINRITEKANVKLILGNHDLYPDLMERIFQREVYASIGTCGWKIQHGHQFDPVLNSEAEREFVAKLARILQVIQSPLLNDIAGLVKKSERSNESLLEAVEEYGGKWIMGHSHLPLQEPNFLNTGCWTGDDLRYILLNEDTGQAGLVKFK